jgi:hypothetical protein
MTKAKGIVREAPAELDLACEAREALGRAAEQLRDIAKALKRVAQPLRVAARRAPVIGEIPWSGERVTLENWVVTDLEAAAADIREKATEIARRGRSNWPAEIRAYVRRETRHNDISHGPHAVNWQHERYLPQLEKMPGYAEAVARIKAHEAAGGGVSLTWLNIVDGRVLEIHNLRVAKFERGKPRPDALPPERVTPSAPSASAELAT